MHFRISVSTRMALSTIRKPTHRDLKSLLVGTVSRTTYPRWYPYVHINTAITSTIQNPKHRFHQLTSLLKSSWSVSTFLWKLCRNDHLPHILIMSSRHFHYLWILKTTLFSLKQYTSNFIALITYRQHYSFEENHDHKSKLACLSRY